MDPITTRPDLNELERIREEVRLCRSVDDLRWCFDRLKKLRPEFQDDFDALYAISTLQNEAVERARELASGQSIRLERTEPTLPAAVVVAAPAREPEPPRNPEAAEIAPEVERLDPKVWQRTLYLALFFGVLLFAAFFYLIQTARRLNLVPATAQNGTATATQNPPGVVPAAQSAETPGKPTVRLYTDLVPGSVTIDGGTPQDLKDGELVLDNLQPGPHSMRVSGVGGSADFNYEVVENAPPKLTDQPTASNAMAVLVSSQNGKARLVTNTTDADVTIDNNPAGHATTDGLLLDNLGKGDHLLQVAQGKDRQRFVWTYVPAPTLTVYVKSDPNSGTVVVLTKEDGADVFINDYLYRRKTEAGQIRIPLKVGEYTIRVHKAGFLDPPPQRVSVTKAEEAEASFRMDALPRVATLQVKGALPGTMVFVDGEMAASIGADGVASISNVKPGEHAIELRREQAVPKRFDRAFKTGDTVSLSGQDVVLEKSVVANVPQPPPPPVMPPAATPSANGAEGAQNNGMQIEGEQVKRGGGFVPYHMPRVAGRYSFAAQVHKSGGFLRRGKFSWYAGFQDTRNYVLFVADGKHVSVHQVIDGKSIELSRVPLEVGSDSWLQVEMSVKPNAITARVKTPDSAWQEVGTVESTGRDFTQNNVGLYVPGNDEVAVANFRFSNH